MSNVTCVWSIACVNTIQFYGVSCYRISTYLVCCCWAGSRNEIMVFRKLFVENNYKLITVPNPYYTADKKVLVLKCHPFVF